MGRDHSCDDCGHGGLNDPNDECTCVDTAGVVVAIQQHGIRSFEEHPAVTRFFLGDQSVLELWEGGWDSGSYWTLEVGEPSTDAKTDAGDPK